MKLIHKIKAVTETIIEVTTNSKNIQDYDRVSKILSDNRYIEVIDDRQKKIDIDILDIYYFEIGEQQKSYCMTINNGYCKISLNLKKLETRLDDISYFLRVNRQIIINIKELQFIETLPNMKLAATLKDGSKHIVSRKYLQELKKVLKGA